MNDELPIHQKRWTRRKTPCPDFIISGTEFARKKSTSQSKAKVAGLIITSPKSSLQFVKMKLEQTIGKK